MNINSNYSLYNIVFSQHIVSKIIAVLSEKNKSNPCNVQKPISVLIKLSKSIYVTNFLPRRVNVHFPCVKYVRVVMIATLTTLVK